MTGVIITYSWGLPLVLNFQDKSEVNDITNQFFELDRNIKIVVHEGDDATRSTQFELNRGLLNYTSSSNFTLVLAGDPPNFDDTVVVIDYDDYDLGDGDGVGRMSYFIRSSMDDLSINSSSPLTGAVDAYPIVDVTQGARDAGLYPAFEEADQNKDITRIVYGRPESSLYSLYLEYRPMIVVSSGGTPGEFDVEVYLIKLVNAGSFPAVGSPKIIVKRIVKQESIDLTDKSSSEDPVYLYAVVDGTYQQLTLDLGDIGSLTLNPSIIITEIQIYDA